MGYERFLLEGVTLISTYKKKDLGYLKVLFLGPMAFSLVFACYFFHHLADTKLCAECSAVL